MRKITYLLAITFFMISLFCYSTLFSQSDEQKFGIDFDGFVRNDIYYDSRKTVDAREGHLLFFPRNEKFDENGVDLNDSGSFHFLSIATRLSGKVSAPDAFGAKTSGLIEAEFFGNSANTINEFRLRHAIIKLNWDKSELLIGQFWHPMFVTTNFPGTVSFNTGIGFQPFSRNPQIRFTHNLGNFRFLAFAFGERDFASIGVDNIRDNQFLRNSKTPQLAFQTHYNIKNEEKDIEFTAGVGAGYKTILPSDVTAANYKTEEMVSSMSALAFAKIKLKPVTIKLQCVYAENMTDILFYGGFAVKDTIDADIKNVSYSPIRNAAAWIDISTNGEILQFGLFAGYNHNMGTANDINPEGIYGFATDIAGLYRVSPRLIWNSGRARISAEVEYTVANYGEQGNFSDRAIPQNTNEVANLRFLIGTYLFF